MGGWREEDEGRRAGASIFTNNKLLSLGMNSCLGAGQGMQEVEHGQSRGSSHPTSGGEMELRQKLGHDHELHSKV